MVLASDVLVLRRAGVCDLVGDLAASVLGVVMSEFTENVQISNAMHSISEAVYYLEDLARALQLTRNSELAGDISDCAQRLRAANEQIRGSWGGYISRQLRESQRDVGETLLTLLRLPT